MQPPTSEWRPFSFRLRHPRSFLLCALGMLAVNPQLAGDDWPQFRGPNCTGISESTKPLPVSFSSTDHVRWSAKLGDGIGSPVVAAGRVYTSGMSSDESIALYCFDARTGERLWHRDWATRSLPEIHKVNSHASTTPAADAERVYFYLSTVGLLALDAKSGREVWRHELPTPYFVFKWGAGMSPILFQDTVVFCQDDDLNPALYAFDKKSGKLLWKDDRQDMAVNYCHPVICTNGQTSEIVVGGTGMLIGYAPDSGKRLWYARTLLRNMKTTPVSLDGTIYIALQSSGIANQWLATADQSETGNKDGKLTKLEMQAFVGEAKIPAAFFRKTFDRGDTNKDGFLEGEELDRAFLNPDNFAGATYADPEPADEFILAVRGGGRGDVTDTHVRWKRPTKYTDHIVSPLVVDDRMILIKGGGISTCFKVETGEPLWGPKRIQNECGYFASPVYGDGKIFVAGDNGYIVVLEKGPDLKILAKNDMGDAILGTPAIADGGLYVRTRSRLICVSASAL